MGTLYAASMMQEFRRRFQRRRELLAAQRAKLLEKMDGPELKAAQPQEDLEEGLVEYEVVYSEEISESDLVSNDYGVQTETESSSGSRLSAFV